MWRIVNLPDFRFRQDGREVRTRGIGFAAEQDGGATVAGAPALGEGSRSVLSRAGLGEDDIAELERVGIVRIAPLKSAQPVMPS